MRFHNVISKPANDGSALVLVMIMSAVALAILASVLVWSASSARLTHRSIQYTRSVAAAEAATEKVVTRITHDFLFGGELLVSNNLTSYRQSTVPTASDSPYWSTWTFDDGNGDPGETYVQRTPGNSYVVLDSTYAGLQGYVSTYTVVSHATDTANPQVVTGGVLQQLQLTGIPIFQFAMYSSGNMEISCGQPFNVTGRVHSNGTLYVEPDSTLTFLSGVTAVTGILLQRDTIDGDTRGALGGTATYVHPDEVQPNVTALTLPIGMTNTPAAVREIIEPPPLGEDPNSPIGLLRYYNQCDMIVVVSDTGITATSGIYDNSQTIVPTNVVPLFVSTNSSFYDAREGKTVEPIDINVTNLTTWTQTNAALQYTPLGVNFSSVYVLDQRSLPAGELSAVRVKNGLQLPPNGLTVATARPLYVQGDYNELNLANLGKTNTLTTRPASLVGDAITVLSDSWTDANSTSDASLRNASATTVNAAFLTGVVETTPGHYSGGMENFPRFLETWGSANVFTYNGSMVKMFPSLYATGVWGQGNVYSPPARNWAYDINFDDPTKLPPRTPSLLKMIRGQWATVPPGQNTMVSFP